jgi:D-alanyl-D-alanine carboxypeptidase
VSKKTKVPFSANAAAKPPTKLGVKAGGSITVETAIYSLVTKSANDAAAALAELFGGSEEGFARMMTAKARKLGMSGTIFRNASGLPNDAQHSTARDLAILGMALKEHFPQYYGYFSTRTFTFGKHRIANHNRLLGRVKGVDGIKTGYTRASGFNLVSSVSDGNRRIVAVVLGGASGRSRDNQMAALIKEYLPKASAKGGRAPLVAKAGGSTIATIAAALLPKRKAPAPEIKPDAVAAEDTIEEAVAAVEESKPAKKAAKKEQVVAATAKQPVAAAPAKQAVADVNAVIEQAFAEPAPRPKAEVDTISTASTAPSGWAVQVASSPSESEAKSALSKTSKSAPAILADASAYTVAFDKDGVTYYRARFGGFGSKTAAWNACGALKKKKIACYAVQQ